MSFTFSLVVIVCVFISSVYSYRGLPSLPGYIDKYEDSNSGKYYNTMETVKLPRMYRTIDQLAKEPEFLQTDPLMARIQKAVQADVQRISEQVGVVSRQVSAIYNNRDLSLEEKNQSLNALTAKYPKIAPSIINLISKIHKVSDYA